MRETQVLPQIRVEFGAVLKRHAMPHPARANPPEDPLSLDDGHSAIRCGVVAYLGRLRAKGRDAAAFAFDMREDTRIRTRVDEDAAGPEDAPRLVEGIDHALSLHSSERPGEDGDIEAIPERTKVLRRAETERDVRHPCLTRVLARGAQRIGIRIDTDNEPRARVRGAESQTSVAGADVKHARAAKLIEDAICGKLDRR